MTAREGRSWLGTASIALMAALVLSLVSLLPEHKQSAPKMAPPSETQPQKSVRIEMNFPPPPITLPPPPPSASFPPNVRSTASPRPTPKRAVPIQTPVQKRTVPPLRPQSTAHPLMREPTVTQLRNGRALLRILEAGAGPVIEIAWPPSRQEREKLYAVLTRCYGMISAIMDSQGQIFRRSGNPGEKWKLNLDRYSSFARQISGRRVAEEKRALTFIRTHHNFSDGMPVRLFPRFVDALLLGGLQKLMNTNYKADTIIRARYHLSGTQVDVTDVALGDQRITGTIPLPSSCNKSANLRLY